MAVRLTDEEIATLVAERKDLPGDFQARFQTRPKRGHRERDLDITGQGDIQFRVILRQSLSNALDFSVILAYRLPQSTEVFRLRRYNGRSHEHTNDLEGDRFYDFHIHQATQRYQELGAAEDAYAERTDRYADMDDAVRCLLQDCGFILPPPPPQLRLPEMAP